MNKILANILYIALILGVFIFMFWIYNFMQGEARECVKQPFLYGASKMQENGDIYCNCVHNVKPIPAPFSFNSTSFTNDPVSLNSFYPKPAERTIQSYNFSFVNG